MRLDSSFNKLGLPLLACWGCIARGFSLGCAGGRKCFFDMAYKNLELDKLIQETMKTLVQCMAQYYALAKPLCSDEIFPCLIELQRRVDQCDLVLRMFKKNEECIAVFVQFPNDLFRGETRAMFEEGWMSLADLLSINHLLIETFYWNAHIAIDLMIGKGKRFKGNKLPQLSSRFPFAGVTNVRNHLIEHPFELKPYSGYNEENLSSGPRLNGVVGLDANNNEIRDQGLFMNADEWARSMTMKLQQAIKVLRATK